MKTTLQRLALPNLLLLILLIPIASFAQGSATNNLSDEGGSSTHGAGRSSKIVLKWSSDQHENMVTRLALLRASSGVALEDAIEQYQESLAEIVSSGESLGKKTWLYQKAKMILDLSKMLQSHYLKLDRIRDVVDQGYSTLINETDLERPTAAILKQELYYLYTQTVTHNRDLFDDSVEVQFRTDLMTSYFPLLEQDSSESAKAALQGVKTALHDFAKYEQSLKLLIATL